LLDERFIGTSQLFILRLYKEMMSLTSNNEPYNEKWCHLSEDVKTCQELVCHASLTLCGHVRAYITKPYNKNTPMLFSELEHQYKNQGELNFQHSFVQERFTLRVS